MRISSKLLSCLLALAVSLTACAAVHDAAAPAPETAASSTTTDQRNGFLRHRTGGSTAQKIIKKAPIG